jgi:hypothetical protein
MISPERYPKPKPKPKPKKRPYGDYEERRLNCERL